MFETIEQVGIGHPDKVADRISDTILDECLKQDKNSRVAIETLIKDNKVIVAGEITTTATLDIPLIVLKVFRDVGYDYLPNVEEYISKQSQDISCGVDLGGAGDQGIMVGYAIDETDNYMPFTHEIATRILMRAEKLRKNGKFRYAKSDMKSQVKINNETDRITTIVLSIQHEEDYNKLEFEEYIKNNIVQPIIKDYGFNTDYKLLINPSGKFVIGGSMADTGVTGRKIIADSYGTVCNHGGAYSGKDPTKVDRSGAYITRKIAKHIVASEMAETVEIKIAYAIGVIKPISFDIECYGTEKVDIDIIKELVMNEFDLTPAGIIKELKLKETMYSRLSTYGHFGINARNMEWEKLNKIESFKAVVKNYTMLKNQVSKIINNIFGGIE